MWLLLSLSVVPRLGRADADGFAVALWAIMGALFVYLSLPKLPRLFRRWFLPVALLVAALGPIIADAMQPQQPEDPSRLYFWLILPLLLVSAQYRIRSVLLFVTLVAVLPLLLAIVRGIDTATLQLHAAHAAGRLIVFLVTGYVIAQISYGQRELRRELAAHNARLAELAATREQLGTSRERNRLARELHDTLAHTLSAVSVQLNALEVLVDSSPADAKTLIRQLQDQTRSGLTEARRALASLRAQPVEELGLVGALDRLTRQAAERAGLTLNLRLPDSTVQYAHYVEQQIYQVAVEAITNVVRHARAGGLLVELRQDGDDLTLTVADDGAGFSPAAAGTAGHYGIRGMHERAVLLGGTIDVRGTPGAGTTITLHIPVENITR